MVPPRTRCLGVLSRRYPLRSCGPLMQETVACDMIHGDPPAARPGMMRPVVRTSPKLLCPLGQASFAVCYRPHRGQRRGRPRRRRPVVPVPLVKARRHDSGRPPRAPVASYDSPTRAPPHRRPCSHGKPIPTASRTPAAVQCRLDRETTHSVRRGGRTALPEGTSTRDGRSRDRKSSSLCTGGPTRPERPPQPMRGGRKRMSRAGRTRVPSASRQVLRTCA